MHIPITAAALLLSASIHASGQTLYFAEVPGDPIPAISTVSISAAGVSPDGATTYVEIGVDPTFVVTTSSQTITFVSAPTPFTNTFLENASGFRQSDTFGDAETCSFASDGSAACVNVCSPILHSRSGKPSAKFHGQRDVSATFIDTYLPEPWSIAQNPYATMFRIGWSFNRPACPLKHRNCDKSLL
ncbi:hypothetical protein B0H17DRAFT_1324186 [Mycena rosella]|uniref:Uncharacterized protein n=1 Tax=Mycena rosella TaxID=1033263 RepID=A0AAD7H1Y5_MYCRO|nr:hypothetical protein B0H17DRAFT_1324186 [Mycena rosella]